MPEKKKKTHGWNSNKWGIENAFPIDVCTFGLAWNHDMTNLRKHKKPYSFHVTKTKALLSCRFLFVQLWVLSIDSNRMWYMFLIKTTSLETTPRSYSCPPASHCWERPNWLGVLSLRGRNMTFGRWIGCQEDAFLSLENDKSVWKKHTFQSIQVVSTNSKEKIGIV